MSVAVEALTTDLIWTCDRCGAERRCLSFPAGWRQRFVGGVYLHHCRACRAVASEGQVALGPCPSEWGGVA